MSRNVSLDEGSNTITVTVTAEDGETTGTYTVTVTRAEAADAVLTAGFENEPELGHDGSGPFELRVRFSEELASGSGRKVARSLSVSGGTRGLVLRDAAGLGLTEVWSYWTATPWRTHGRWPRSGGSRT